ncbi:hypothetical protein LL037_14305 [Clostridium estertheticum]|uniref:Uncharacterized protein n=1 Tax=Clostridium estertheticum TaxID=238834 RepID=A0AA47EL44_9CLOT|nr:hypothetical protein [Clostridium estertheticum]MBU3156742.1 hypothetical protein [Clostridium estertheticum]MBU3199081.1 hypothetical protein [Clostridium estertheticum]WAG62233.1 hypothetical protein LL038_08355 [Clostridium estertheticum]WAG63654.1 hypothetical protein LL037_14305 [Clostridium estertheticum]
MLILCNTIREVKNTKPLNTVFVKNGLKATASALLTLTLGLSITIGVITLFSNYIAIEFHGIIKELTAIVKTIFSKFYERNLIKKI